MMLDPTLSFDLYRRQPVHGAPLVRRWLACHKAQRYGYVMLILDAGRLAKALGDSNGENEKKTQKRRDNKCYAIVAH